MHRITDVAIPPMSRRYSKAPQAIIAMNSRGAVRDIRSGFVPLTMDILTCTKTLTNGIPGFQKRHGISLTGSDSDPVKCVNRVVFIAF